MSAPALFPPIAADTIPPALVSELEKVASQVRERLGSVTKNVIEIGRELQAVKNRLQHGRFIDWVEAACGLSRRTAQLMINAAQWAEDKSETVTLLEPTTIYLLAAPSTPKAVVDTVLSRAEAGEVTAPRIVRDMIRAQKGKVVAETEPPLLAWINQAKQEDRKANQAHEHPSVGPFDALMEAWDCADENARTTFLQRIDASLNKRLEREPARTVCEAGSGPNKLSDTPLESGRLGGETVETAPPDAIIAETGKLIEIFEVSPRHTRTWIKGWVEAGAPPEDTSQENPRTNEARAPFRVAYPEVSPASQASFLQYLKGCPEHV